MPGFRTPFNGYSVRFSPFVESRLAVATSQNFGIIGNGRLHILELGPGGIGEGVSFDTSDGLYDVCWSEANENILATASGDGSVKVWDAAAPPGMNPIRSFHEHTHEVYGLAWNTVRRDAFLSASWDDTLKLWTLEGPPASLRTFAEHAYCVYDAAWNPRHADLFASASGDHTVRVWDLREHKSTLAIPAHSMEVLSCDWSKVRCAAGSSCAWAGRQRAPRARGRHVRRERASARWLLPCSDKRRRRECDIERALARSPDTRFPRFPSRRTRCVCPYGRQYEDCILMTGSVDSTIRAWDIRNPGRPLATLGGHNYAVRRVQCSPHHPELVMSCSYDMSVCLWDWKRAAAAGTGDAAAAPAGGALLARHDHHTEFAVGMDMSCLVDGLFASCGWDENVYVWRQGTDPRAGPM